jgi:plasmid stabilization system protein ParE
MVLRFTPDAFQDLYELDGYLQERSPQGLRKVSEALLSAFAQIQNFPN